MANTNEEKKENTGYLLSEKFKKQGQSASNMSAFEMAAMGKYMQQDAINKAAAKEAEDNGTTVKKNTDPVLLEMDDTDTDWNMLVMEAKSKGPRSWFASKVDFSLNGAHFLGKVGFPVKAGVVPLFDGAAIDLQSARLRSQKPKDAKPDQNMGSPEIYDNWITGVGGMLVLAPIGMDNVIPITMKSVTITEKGITGQANKEIRFYHGLTSVEATGIELTLEGAKLKNAKTVMQDGDNTVEVPCDATVTGVGINIEKKKKAETPTPAPTADNTPVNVNDVENLAKKQTKSQELQETLYNKGKEKLEEGIQIGPATITNNSVEVNLQSGDDDDNGDENGEKPGLLSDAADTLKQAAQNGGEEALNLLVNKGPKAVIQKGKEKIGELKGITDHAAQSFNKDTVKNGANILKNSVLQDMTEEDAEEAWRQGLEDQGKVLEEIKEFLGIKDTDKDQEEDKEKDKKGDFNLLAIPIVPGVNFKVSLQPEFSYKFFLNVKASDLDKFYKKLLNTPKDQKESGTALLTFTAGIKASLSLGAKAGMEEGIPFLIKGFQGLKAAATLSGNQGDDNQAIKLSVVIPIKRTGQGEYAFGDSDIAADLSGGLNLTGSVGAEVSMESKLLQWRKTLWETTFAEWKLATIGLNIGVTKAQGSKGITEGWSLNEANVSVAGPKDGIGQAFTTSNPAEKKYGLTTPDLAPSRDYGEVQNDFEKAIELLKIYANPPAGRALVIPNSSNTEFKEDNGVTQVMVSMEKIANDFTGIWAKSQEVLEGEQKKLNDFQDSSVYKLKKEKASTHINRHSERIAALDKWKKTQGNAEGNGVVPLETYYNSKAGFGKGFKRAIRERVENRALSFENIVAYEKERYLELTASATERIKLLQSLLEKQAKGGQDAPTDQAIINEYSKKSGAKAFDHKAMMLGSAKSIIDYEVEQQLKNTAEEREHHSIAYALSVGKKVNEEKKKARETAEAKKLSKIEVDEIAEQAGMKKFFELYSAKITDEHALQYGSVKGLMAYERGRMDVILKEKKGKDGNGKVEYWDDYVNASINRKFAAQEIVAQNEKIKQELYRTATLNDLIDFEMTDGTAGAGKKLTQFLAKKEKSKKKSNLNSTRVLTKIYGEESGQEYKDALKVYGERLKKRQSEENIKYLTLELLLDYAEKRKSEAKNLDQVKSINSEIFFLNRSKLIVESASPEKALETETNQIRIYFERFGQAASEYQEGLSKGKAVNIPLMRAVLTNEESDAMQRLREIAASGKKTEDYLIVEEYLAMKDADAKNRLNNHLKEQMKKPDVNKKQIANYNASKLAEEKDGVGKHFNRVSRLQKMVNEGASYSQMIEEYKKMGGTKGYIRHIKENVKKGIIFDQDMSRGMTMEDVLKFEQRRINDAGAANEALIQFVEENKDKMSYPELLEEYEKRSKENTLGAIQKKIDQHIKLSSGYEKSFKDAKVTPQQILDYEKSEQRRAGMAHQIRLMKLYGVENFPEDLNQLVEPTDEKVKQERVKEYMKDAKRVKSDSRVKQAKEMILQDIYSDQDKLFSEMYSYETERKTFYTKEFEDILKIQDDISKRMEILKNQIDISSKVVLNISQVKEHPEEVFDKINVYEEVVKMSKNQEQVQNEVQAQQQELLAESEDRQQKVIDKVIEDTEGAKAK